MISATDNSEEKLIDRWAFFIVSRVTHLDQVDYVR
ncbi:hypothetical protein Rumal_3493 (plasmid) [Ruminococcus albus 7 = DSM 20455]|uniref:Uncharacterized protein n=1 Tax=Ruminococcus albus (strain ATCC 27210 / DSM 20455 / JCM 14654 / NCDO 2250 / 7) TaxID=697329 RepID=E6UJU4_RUMA7|nr:hypothetical protein Rumal_3493 [Ruminococcus albus 7 = DSM 20455]